MTRQLWVHMIIAETVSCSNFIIFWLAYIEMLGSLRTAICFLRFKGTLILFLFFVCYINFMSVRLRNEKLWLIDPFSWTKFFNWWTLCSISMCKFWITQSIFLVEIFKFCLIKSYTQTWWVLFKSLLLIIIITIIYFR